MSKALYRTSVMLVCLITGSLARADLAPHPTSHFNLIWSGPPASIVNASLFKCSDRDCTNPRALPLFVCDRDHCLERYGAKGLYKLSINLGDRTLASDVFEKTGFESTFVVLVEPDHLAVELTDERLPYQAVAFVANFLRATLITLAIEFPIVYLLLKRWEVQFRGRLIVYANLATLPIVWLLTILVDRPTATVAIELTVIFAEALFYWRTMRNGGLRLTRALTASAFANAGSIAIPLTCTYVAMRLGFF